MLKALEVLHQSIQTKAIAVGTETANLTYSYSSNVGVVAESFSLVDIAQVYLDGGQTYSGDRVSNGHAGMSIGTRIDQNSILLAIASLNAIY